MKQKVRDLNLQDNEIRLQLYLARCGVASRRGSESYITDGRVSVNGEVVKTLGTKVSMKDSVFVDGKQIFLEEEKKYVVLNKPAGYVCSLNDEKNREVAADLLKPYFKERLFNVGRLDMFSEGLIIFTNDGDFMQMLSHPSSQVEKEYVVEASMPIPPELIEKFQKGIRVEGVFYKCRSAELLGKRKAQFVLIEGKNREIRRVFEHFQIGIKTLIRVRIGHIKLDGLSKGSFRELSKKDIDEFKTVE